MRVFGLFLACLMLLSCGEISPSQETNFEDKLTLLLKDPGLKDYFTIDESGIALYANPADKLAGTPEIKVYPEEYRAFRNLFSQMGYDTLLTVYQMKGESRFDDDFIQAFSYNLNPLPVPSDSFRPLAGLRVAIDPGHIAADMEKAEMEGKYVKMKASRETEFEEIAFNEANLTLATALLLKEKLDRAGATTLLTRTAPGVNASGLTFEQWKTDGFESALQTDLAAGRIDAARADFLRRQSDDTDIYRRVFVPEDLRRRAEKINGFRPHLTAILHYNIHSPNWDMRDNDGFFTPSYANYSMAFVPGAFMNGELDLPEYRLQFLRLLLTEDVENSLSFSEKVLDQFKKHVNAHPVSIKEGLRYLVRASIRSEKEGVYARNLSLTRMIHGPICYGETLCQDNLLEAKALNKKDLIVGDLRTSSRIIPVADAYYEAILGYVTEKE